jgi:CheY-like chemotaxis protein
MVLIFQARCLGGDAAPFEDSPLRQNPAQQAWLRSEAKQSQEKFRVQFALPRSALAPGLTQRLASPTTYTGLERGELWVQSLLTPHDAVLLGILVCLAGLLYLPRVAPEFSAAIARQFTSPGAGASLADEKAFSQFLVSFKAGPPSVVESRDRVSNAADHPPVPRATPALDYSTIRQQTVQAQNVLQTVLTETDPGVRRQLLQELRIRIGTVTRMTSSGELLPLWQVATATEGLVGQLMDRSRVMGSGAYETVGAALDLLIAFCKHRATADLVLQGPIRILAVDDDPISRHAVGLSLKKAFNQPDLAANGEAALAQAAAIGYDVIFLDIMMPGMNGFELCAKIRQTPRNAGTPIVFVSAKNEPETVAEASRCGGTDLVTKPFLIFEITVKALVLALGGRLARCVPGFCLPALRAPVKAQPAVSGS